MCVPLFLKRKLYFLFLYIFHAYDIVVTRSFWWSRQPTSSQPIPEFGEW